MLRKHFGPRCCTTSVNNKTDFDFPRLQCQYGAHLTAMSHSTLPASAYEALELPPATIEILTNPKPGDPLAPEASPNLLQGAQKPEQPLAPNESSIILYAELLLHIRTVTLFASLRSFHTRETKAQLATDGFSITVTHEGESATIHLPIKVKGGGDAALSLPAQPPSKELTLRLQIEEKEGTDLLGTLRSEQRNANLVPWDGASLNHIRAVEIRCKSCQGVIAPASKVGEWRDLPNENWAEMMDFWHCHKPDEHHLHDHNRHAIVGKKGYAAGNRLKAVDGVGFVDLATFLLKEQDCEGAEVCYPSFLMIFNSPSVLLHLGMVITTCFRAQRRRPQSIRHGGVADTNALE